MIPTRLPSSDGAIDYLRWVRCGGVVMSGALFFLMLALQPALVAPAEAEEAGPAVEETEELDVEEVASETGAEDGADVGSVTTGDGPKQRTMLDTIIDGGVIGGIIILLSIIAVGFIIEHMMSLRKAVLMPEPVMADLEQLIGQGQIDKAIEYCHRPETQSLATSIVLAGLERFKGSQFGFAEYKSACEEEGEEQTSRLYRKTEVLGVIGAVAPMLGLLGTVAGMILAFNTIALKRGMASPEDLAGAIGQALVTTLLGLSVAIPTVVAFSYFRNRIDSIVSEAGKRIERIMMPLGRQRQK